MARYRICSLLVCLCLLPLGCRSSPGFGDEVGLGAIAGRHTGYARDTKSTGAGVGDGVGYLIADELDQTHAKALTDATVGSNYSHDELGPLTNTRWRVLSMTPENAGEGSLTMVVTFRPSGHLVTRTILPDSSSRLVTERYRVVGDTLIINRDDYIINAQYRIRGETLTIGAGDFVGVFERMRSRDGL